MTTVLNAWSIDYPSITNRLRAAVYTQNDPEALVATIIDSVSGHPARVWTFPGLPRNNYGFILDEIDGSDLVVRNLAKFAVVPGEIDGQLVRDDEEIQCDVTPGFVAGTTSFVMDGTVGKPDYRGWNIVPSELTGRGILVRGLDYSWDKVTGTFALLIAGDVFATGNYYNIHFNDILNPAGNSYPSLNDFLIKLITDDENILASDFGDKILIEPSGVYLIVSLPDITTVVVGRPLMIETGDTGIMFCAKIQPNGSDVINFKNGLLFMCPSESLRIYRYKKPDTSNEWRVYDLNGNFKTVGQVIGTDEIEIINGHLLDGESVVTNQYARIYNDVILNLPIGQVVDYDSWTSNQTFYSKDNSSNPSAAGHFYFPNRLGIFEKNNNTGKAGDYQKDQVGESTFNISLHTGDSFTGHPYPPTALGKGLISDSPVDITQSVTINTGIENLPKNTLINKMVLV